MIMLTLSAMVGTSKLMVPYLNDLAQRDETERFRQLALNLLLSAGTPINWGQTQYAKPNSLGFAQTNSSEPYGLDIDKVTRLNSENIYSLTYSDLWKALGTKDVSFQIEIKPLFDVSIDLISTSTTTNQTVYAFQIATKKSGTPVEAQLSGHVAIEDFVDTENSFTLSNGLGALTFSVPNSISGAALIVVFARAQSNSRILSFGTYAFGHNSSAPLPNGTFTRISPLNYVLNTSLPYSATEIVKAVAFTFNYDFDLTEKSQIGQSAEYVVPRLLDPSPMILALTGHNGSTSFAEWVSYPQLPLTAGASFAESTAGSKIVSITHIISIDSVLFEAVTRWGSQS
jgi:hypothetical protein